MEMVIENKAIEPVAAGEVRAALDELLSAFEEFKAANDARLSEIEARGGKLLDAYVTLGRYDVVELFEAPDDETAYRILTELAKHGLTAEQNLDYGFFVRDPEGIPVQIVGT